MREIEYPQIFQNLIDVLERDFPDKLPRSPIDSYNLGILVGQQQVIDKLKAEKFYQEDKKKE